MQKKADKASSNKIDGWEGEIADDVERRNFKEANTAAGSIKSQLQQLRAITAKTGKSFSPSTRADAEAIIAGITADLKEFKKLGTLDKGVESLINKFIQNPTSIFTLDSSSLAKINQFEKYIDTNLQKAAKTHGLRKLGDNIGTFK
jgi:adenine C2-methylase RlmN of 23S rRNA A2503 and tRNA A37